MTKEWFCPKQPIIRCLLQENRKTIVFCQYSIVSKYFSNIREFFFGFDVFVTRIPFHDFLLYLQLYTKQKFFPNHSAQTYKNYQLKAQTEFCILNPKLKGFECGFGRKYGFPVCFGSLYILLSRKQIFVFFTFDQYRILMHEFAMISKPGFW